MTLSEIALFVFNEIKSQSLTVKKFSSQGFSINGTQFSKTGFSISAFLNIIPGLAEKLDSASPTLRFIIELNPGEFLLGLRHCLDQDVAAASQQVLSQAEGFALDVGFLPEHSSLGSLRIFQDPLDSKLFIYSSAANNYQTIKWKSLETQIEKLPKEVKPMAYEKIETASIVYHPALPLGPFEVTKYQATHFDISTAKALNTYCPPPWRGVKVECPRLHPTIDKLIKFMFIGEGCQQHVYRWIRSLLFDHELLIPVMILHSAGGMGKGVLIEHILRGLVGGSGNYVKPPAKQGGRFDKYIASSHLYYSSEAELDEKLSNRLKDLYDQYSNFEGKGVDVGKGRRIAARFILSSNDSSNLYMSYDARKFTVPDLIRGPQLKEFMNREEFDFLLSLKENDLELASFARWLEHEHKSLENEEVWHGSDFVDLCETHISDWFKLFRGMLQKQIAFSYEEFCSGLPSRSRPGISTMDRNIKMYELARRQRICEVMPSPDGTADGYLYKSLNFNGGAK